MAGQWPFWEHSSEQYELSTSKKSHCYCSFKKPRHSVYICVGFGCHDRGQWHHWFMCKHKPVMPMMSGQLMLDNMTTLWTIWGPSLPFVPEFPSFTPFTLRHARLWLCVINSWMAFVWDLCDYTPERTDIWWCLLIASDNCGLKVFKVPF